MKRAPEKFRFAALAVDIVVLGFVEGEPYILVSTVNRPPHYVNIPGFLGGMVSAEETAEAACTRILKEKGGISKLYLEQLYTFSAINRDKRNRVVSIAHLALVSPNFITTYKHAEASFRPLKECKKLAYDHDEMLAVALKRLAGKLTYTTIAQHLLPGRFTLTELQVVYEAGLGITLDKRNFRKKILALDILKETGQMQEGVKNRPAALYEFSSSQIKELPLIV